MADLRELLAQVENGTLEEKKKCKKKKKKLEESMETCSKCDEAYDNEAHDTCPNCEYGMIESDELTLDALESILEMVEEDSLTELEEENLIEAIDGVFNSILNDDYIVEFSSMSAGDVSKVKKIVSGKVVDASKYSNTGANEGTDAVLVSKGTKVKNKAGEEESFGPYADAADDLDAAGFKVNSVSGGYLILKESEDEDCDGEVCFDCGECVDELNEEYKCEDCASMNESEEEISEAQKLKKSSVKAKKAAKKYAKTAAGKKAKLKTKKKRKKFADKIAACEEKGKSFSIRTKRCRNAKETR